MSHEPPPLEPFGTIEYRAPGIEPPGSNPLGVAGFTVSMVGVLGFCFPPAFFCGVIGAALSGVAMTRRPRGLAIAGLIVGALETLAAIAIAVAVFLMYRNATGNFSAAMMTAQTMATGAQMRQVIEYERSRTGTLPATLSSVQGLTATSDAWGRAIRYVPNAPTNGAFELISDGPDGIAGTADDLHLNATAATTTWSPTTLPDEP